MGVPGLLKWISSVFPQVFINSSKMFANNFNLDTLYIDLNHVLHLKARRFHNNPHRFIDSIINHLENYKIKRKIHIAMDGMAPLAKIKEQIFRRQRRTESFKKIDSINSNNFTPGLPFMAKLERLILAHFTRSLSFQSDSNSNNIRIHIDGASNIEEGETKILRNIYQQSKSKTGIMNASIISGDSDFIIQSLKIPNSNLTIFDDQNNSPGYFSNRILMETLKDSRLDFVLLGLMMGSDTIQPLKYAPGLKFLWDSFLQFHHSLYQEENGKIDLIALKEFASFHIKRTNLPLPLNYSFSPSIDIASYIKSLEWSMRQLEMNPIECFQSQPIDSSFISIFDLEKMNISRVQFELDIINSKKIILVDEFQFSPAAISIILTRRKDSNLLSNPLMDLYIQYHDQNSPFSIENNNLEGLLWLSQQIKQINPSNFTMDEWNASIYQIPSLYSFENVKKTLPLSPSPFKKILASK